MLATLSAMCDEPCEDQYIWPGIREYRVIATEPTVLQIQENF